MKNLTKTFMSKLTAFSTVLILFVLLSKQSVAQPYVRLEFSNEHLYDSTAPYGAVTDIYCRFYQEDYCESPYAFSSGEYYNLYIAEYTNNASYPYTPAQWNYDINFSAQSTAFLLNDTVLYNDPDYSYDWYTLHYAILAGCNCSGPTTFTPEPNLDDTWY
jgi:hypothetical protein